MRYRIAITDTDEYGKETGQDEYCHSATAYWVTRFGDTDNYSYDVTDATVFASKSAAKALMKTLKLDDEHYIEETY